MASLFRAYNLLLERQPLLTKGVTSSVLFAAGDGAAQCVAAKGVPDKYDWARSRRMAVYGGVVFAPLAHTWFIFLEKAVTGRAMLVKKVVADQLVYTPPINICFFTFTTLAAGKGVNDVVSTVKDKLWPTLKVNWTVWPVAQAINFALVPLQYRVLFVNVVSLGWSMFLSSMANDGSPEAALPEAALHEAALEYTRSIESHESEGETAE